MNRELVLFPLFVMVALSFYVTWRLGKQRVQAIIRDGVTPGYFYYNKGGRLPDYLLRTEQHYTNLFEQPVLFYTAVLLAYRGTMVDTVSLSLAWAYALSRIAHAYIHMAFNKLKWRRRAFILSFLLLSALWLDLLWQSVML